MGEIIGKYSDGIASINKPSENVDVDVDVEEVEINGVSYYATNIINGDIYSKLPDESVGDYILLPNTLLIVLLFDSYYLYQIIAIDPINHLYYYNQNYLVLH